MNSEKNILVTTMSILNGSMIEKDYYAVEEDTGKKVYCKGFCTMEPGSKYILHKYQINEIIAIGTDKTISNAAELTVRSGPVSDLREELSVLESNNDKWSAFEFYKYRIIKYLLDQENAGSLMMPLGDNRERAEHGGLSIQFVSEQVEGSSIDNINGIVKAIYGSTDQEINLYFDVQGGNRTSSYVRNAALSILSNQYQDKIHIKEIVAVNYDPNKPGASEIVDETKRYRILDLASGMNAFIQYGKADLIKRYCQDMDIKKDSKVDKLVECMVKIDEAISLCNMSSLTKAVEKMSEITNGINDSYDEGNDSLTENIFTILTDGIKKDYGKLLEVDNGDLSGEDETAVDYLELISWCKRKGFIQQALTLIEDKMPDVFWGKKVLICEFVNTNNNSKTVFLNSLGQSYESENNKIFNNLKLTEYDCNTEDLSIPSPSPSGPSLPATENVSESIIADVEKQLSTDLSDNDFVQAYCRFRRLEFRYESGKTKTRFKDHLSILVCRGQNKKFKTKNKHKSQNQNQDQDYVTAYLDFKVNSRLSGQNLNKLDQLLLLHEALKKERNCCNHASEKGIRLPIDVVKRAIEIYIKNTKEILFVVNNSQA